MRRLIVAIATVVVLVSTAVVAQPPPLGETATRAVYLDQGGVIRWRDDNSEVALFGANYCLMSGSDYRMAGLAGGDRKRMIDEDMAQFTRMGWTALRLCSWGDWENSDRDGNLVVNDHIDVMDYLIAKARERGIYILLTPIHGYNPAFADRMGKPEINVGFSRYHEKSEMGTNPTSIAAQANYIGQLLKHVNPYTGVALKDEPALLFIELFNEPIHHPEDVAGSVGYIDTLVKAVRDTGCTKITFFNYTQDIAIGEAIRRSKADGFTMGWYPSGLVAGRTLRGNFLQAVDNYPDMLRPELTGRPRLVYEFDTADLNTGYLYPAMARTYRSVGAQFAAMFAYDQLRTAPFNLGWQTHYLNLVHTPRKAMSTVIAAEAMRRLPRMQDYGRYPDNRAFGDFRVSYENDSSELNAADAYMNAGDTGAAPKSPGTLTRVAGVGSSPVVAYEGTGAYFLDKVRDGVWRLEVYPDEVLVRDPFEQPQPGKVVSRLLYRGWPMTVHLPDLGDAFVAQPIKVPHDPAASTRRANGGSVNIEPGVWLLAADARADRTAMPARINRVGFSEFHVNDFTAYPDAVLSLAPDAFVAGSAVEIRARVANTVPPDAVKLWLRPLGTRFFGDAIAMKRVRGNDYAAMVPADKVPPGRYEFAVTTVTGNRATTFPGGVAGQPGEWPFMMDTVWSFDVTQAGAPLRLFHAASDTPRLSFVRPGETYRFPFFHVVPGESTGESALSLELPDLGKDTPERYAAALFIGDAIAARGRTIARSATLHVRVKSVGGARKTLDLALIEKDGAAWRTNVVATSDWADVAVPLSSLRIGRSIHIPSPFPALWDYWREVPEGRGQASDRINLANVERLELVVLRNAGDTARDNGSSVVIESVWLTFGDGVP